MFIDASMNRLRDAMPRPSCRRAAALVQLLVLMMLAVPASCFDMKAGHEASGGSRTAGAADAGHDQRPCCSDENEPGSDGCSTCNYCSYNAPLMPETVAGHAPAAGRLAHLETPANIPDVHIPIFVPPQIPA
jgi:hypothetical protein